MRLSVWPMPTNEWSDLLATAQLADAGDWHCCWFADHYMPNTEDGSVADGGLHEAWAVLAALAASTERVRLGPLVSPTTVHHPAILANRATTIDHVSDGRFTLGLGAGWQVNEHHAYGIELYEVGPRVSRFDEAIQATRALLANDRATFHGEYFDITDAPCQPGPIQDPLPIVVGTGSPRMMGITIRHADQWNVWGDLPEATAKHELFVSVCEREGRDPASMWRSTQAMVFLVDDADQAAKVREHAPADRSIVGTTEQLTETLRGYGEVGFDEFIVLDATLGRDPQQRRDAYLRLQEEVMPHLA